VCNGIAMENNSVMRQKKICTMMCVKIEEAKGRKTKPERGK
jgi:hypothetical protein